MSQQCFPFPVLECSQGPQEGLVGHKPLGWEVGSWQESGSESRLHPPPLLSTREAQKGLSSLVPSLGILSVSTCAPGPRAIPWGKGGPGIQAGPSGLLGLQSPPAFSPLGRAGACQRKQSWTRSHMEAPGPFPPASAGLGPRAPPPPGCHPAPFPRQR